MQKCIAAGRCDAIITWWTLHMYKDIDLTTAPGYWCMLELFNIYDNIIVPEWVKGPSPPWRDHWMQGGLTVMHVLFL